MERTGCCDMKTLWQACRGVRFGWGLLVAC